MSSNPLNSIFLQQRCDNALKTCNFASATGQDCAAQFCQGFPGTSGTCPQIGLDPQNCCGSNDPASCLASWVQNGGGGGAVAANVCASVVSIIAECSSQDPALFPSNSIYTSGPQATSLAACMCYDQDGTYDPELDGFASECVASGSAAHPTYFKYGSLLNDFCTNNAAPATASATTTTTNSGSPGQTTTSTGGGLTTSSDQTGATSTPSAGITSSAKLSSTSQASATAATTTSSGSLKKSFHTYGIVVLIGFSMLFSSF